MARVKVDNKLNVVIGTKAQVEGDTSIPENSIIVVTDEELKADDIVYSVERKVEEAIWTSEDIPLSSEASALIKKIYGKSEVVGGELLSVENFELNLNNDTFKITHNGLHSTPNGKKDIIEYDNDGGYILNRCIQGITLMQDDFEILYKTYNNVDVIRLKDTNLVGIKDFTDHMYLGYRIGDFKQIRHQDTADGFLTTDANSFSISSGNRFFIIIPKGTYANIAEAKADLAGTKMVYELQEEITEVVYAEGELKQSSFIQLEQKQTLATSYDIVLTISKKLETIPDNGWKDKIWVSFGDSITVRGLWQPYVITALDLIHINCGIGSTLLAGTSASAFWQDARLDVVKAANPDVITILGGANDITQDIPIGTDAEFDLVLGSKDTDNFKGAYSYIIENLLTWKPTLKIFIMTTTYAHSGGSSYSPGGTMEYYMYADASREVAQYYGLPVIDLYREMMVNKLTQATYTSDGIHPNTKGCKRIAELTISKFKENNPL